MKRFGRLAIVLVISFLTLSFAFAGESADRTLSPYFFVQGDPTLDQLPLKDTRVDIAISGVIADVSVSQTYSNEGSRPINARYIFPASTRAAVYAMQMVIGDQVIVAKIKEREQAKQEFERAKEQGKSASLLEEQRPNVFSMSVANILPGDRVEIQLHYTELLVPTDGVYELVYPTVVGPRYSSQQEGNAPTEDQWVKNPYLHSGDFPKSGFHLTTTISSPVPIQDLTCPSHQINTRWKSPTNAEFGLEESDVFQANRDFVLRYRLAGQQIASGLLLYKGTDENFFLYMAQPPARVVSTDIPRREYIFVVDVSGSMYGFPLEVSKQLLRNLIGNLRPTDLFNVILFSGNSLVMSPESLPANQESIARAIHLIDSQNGGGGTELLAALNQAMELPHQDETSRAIVLITDGYIEAERDVFDAIRNHLDQTNFFAFGIGSSVNRYLIEGVARAGMGEPFVVTEPEEAAGVASRFREYIETPVLTGIHLDWSGFDAYDVQPASYPDLYAQRPIVVFGKWRGTPSGAFELSGQTGAGPFHARQEIAAVKPEESNRALRYLWARSRIADLSDFASDTDSELADRITSLGLKYNLLTRYTSFIAVREKIRNRQTPAQDVNQPLPLPKGVSDLAVGGSITSESEPELLWILVLLVLMALLRTRSMQPVRGRIPDAGCRMPDARGSSR